MRLSPYKIGSLVVLCTFVIDHSSAQDKPIVNDVRGYPLPKGAIARLGPPKLKHTGQIYALVFSPDGKWLASAGADQVICVWDVATGKALIRLKGHRDAVRCLVFVPTGDWEAPKTLISGSDDKTIRFWDLKTGKELPRVISHAGAVTSLAVSKNGRLLASGGSTQARIFLWQVEDGSEICHWKAHRGGITALAFLPDGKTIVSGGQAQQHSVPGKADEPKDSYGLAIWDTETGKVQHIFPGHTSAVCAVALSADGKRLASSGIDNKHGGSLLLWDTAKGQMLRNVGTRASGGPFLAMTPDGKTLVEPELSRVAVWDANTGDADPSFLGPDSTHVEALAFSPNGKTLACTLRPALQWTESRVAAGGKKLASEDNDWRILLWDVAQREPNLLVQGHTTEISSVAVSPDGKTIATTGADGTWLWDRATSKPVHQLIDASFQGRSFVRGAAFSPDSRTIALSHPAGSITFWNVKSGQLERKLAGKDFNGIVSLVYSSDGKWLACENILLPFAAIVNAATGKLVRTFPRGNRPFEGSGYSVAISPDGRYLASAASNGLKIWALHSSQLIFEKESGGRSVAYSPGGFLVTLAGKRVKILDASNGAELAELNAHVYHKAWRTVAFSPDGRLLAVAASERLSLWDVFNGRELPGFEGHLGKITSVAFTPDGKALVTGSEDGTALVWDLNGILPTLATSNAKADWDDLNHRDRLRAYAAFCRLRASKDVAFKVLKAYLKPTIAISADRAADLLKKLDSDNFQLRDQAFKELRKLGLAAEKAMVQARKNKPSLETSRRLDLLLAELTKGDNWRRDMIAIQLLEEFSTPPASELLESLSKGDPDLNMTREAIEAVQRIRKRDQVP